jgi:hypothetical protein
MAKFVYAYRGGSTPQSEAEGKAVMEKWGAWFGTLGAAVIDGGNPFGASKTVASNGSAKDGGSAGLGGYSIVDATSLDDAASKAKGCPILEVGGTVDVYEAMDM